MADKPKTTKRKLTVTGQETLATWEKDGEETTIYKVSAVSEQGDVVDVDLRTFQEDLPQGELIEFDVAPYDHPKYGRSFTLKMPSKGRASKKDIAEMQKQLTALAGRVSALEEKVGKEGKPPTSGSDDDIPF